MRRRRGDRCLLNRLVDWGEEGEGRGRFLDRVYREVGQEEIGRGGEKEGGFFRGGGREVWIF